MDPTLAWAIISGLALAVAGEATYIVKLHREIAALNDEYKAFLRGLLR